VDDRQAERDKLVHDLLSKKPKVVRKHKPTPRPKETALPKSPETESEPVKKKS
jgi:hypothetical protein